MAPPTSAARPKRAGDDFARTNHHDHHPRKKPRFDPRNPSTLAADAPTAAADGGDGDGDDVLDELILDADIIGKSGPQIKRNAVNIDGYESDSENDNFDARAAERGRGKKGGDDGGVEEEEEEEDMFADLDEKAEAKTDDVRDESRKGKKDVRFLDAEEIEGQVKSSTSGGHVSADLLQGQRRHQREASSSSSSGSDEERDLLPGEMEDDLAAEVGAGGKKRHAPRLDAFNLKEEEEDGRYDEAGNYVRKAVDPEAGNDGWLEGVSKKDVRRAREAQEKREGERRRKAEEDDAVLTGDVLATLIAGLETGETPLEALKRLNARGRKGKKESVAVPKWKRKKRREEDGMEVDGDVNGGASITAEEEAAETRRKQAVEAITGAADALYSRAQHDVYDTEREMLMRQYARETGEEWRPAAAAAVQGGSGDDDSRWEYRWDGGESHGPYDGATMKAWNEAGYFAGGVEFRKVGGGGGGEWDRVLDVR